MVGEKLCLGDKCPNAQAQERAKAAQETVKNFRARLAEYADNLVVAETHKRLYEAMMVLDLTTGVFSRKGLDMKFGEELSRFQRFGRGFALLFIRVDGFEKLKAEKGQETSDKVLVLVAGAIKDSIRVYDSVHRIENADFTVLLPETDSAGLACSIAERLRSKVEAMQLAPDRTNSIFSVTVSVGIAMLETGGNSNAPRDGKKELERMLGNAMKAEGIAESEGMNRVSVHPSGAQP